MTKAGRPHRPRTLAMIFGAYLACTFIVSWYLVWTGVMPTIAPDISRWIFFAYLVAASIFMVGVGVLAFSIQDSFEERVRGVNRRLGGLVWDGETSFEYADLMKELGPKGSSSATPEDDTVEILESLGEAQGEELLLEAPASTTATDEVEFAQITTMRRLLVRRRQALKMHEDFLAAFLPGPMAVAAGLISISAAMLYLVEVLPPPFYASGSVMSVALAYALPGLAAYFAMSILSIIRSLRTERRVRKR